MTFRMMQKPPSIPCYKSRHLPSSLHTVREGRFLKYSQPSIPADANLPIQRAECPTSFYIKDLSTCELWCVQGVMERR